MAFGRGAATGRAERLERKPIQLAPSAARPPCAASGLAGGIASPAFAVLLRRVDPVTHVLLGASIGYVAFGHRLGRSAALAGGLAAFVPDADFFIRSAADPLVAIEHHRGFTHSLAFAPAGAAIVAALWLVRPSWRRRRWFILWLGCALAYVSHALLDACTTYGTQLLWPFSRHRVGWDVISIIDPAFTLPLLIGLTWATVRQRIAPAAIGLLIGALYLGVGTAQQARASAAQQAMAASRGHRIERAEVLPTLANNVVWRALYVHDNRIFSDRIRVGWFSPATVREGWSLPVVREKDLSTAESGRNANRSFQRFAWFSDGWVARSPADHSLLADMRYSLSTEAFDPIWGIRFTSPAERTEVVWVNRSREREIRPGELWNEIRGGDAQFRPVPTRQASSFRKPAHPVHPVDYVSEARMQSRQTEDRINRIYRMGLDSVLDR